MQPKKVVLDKTIKVAKKTSPAFKSSLKNIARTTSDIIVNYGDDLYENLDDVSTDGAKSLVSNGVMASRSFGRTTKSTNNILKRHHVKKSYVFHHKENFKNLKGNEADLIQQPMKQINKNLNQQDKKLTKDAKQQWAQQSRKQKSILYQKNHISKGIDIKKSSVMTIQNQIRKGTNVLANKNDISSKSIGKVSKGVWSTFRLRKQITQMASAVTHVASFVTHSISSFVSFVVAIPTLITTIVASVPLIAIISAVIMIISIFSSTEYSGRLTSFVENEVYLEYRYNANISPDEILSITTALGWSSQKKEDYEALFALLMDGKDESWNISYETMQNNIFNKYNPANFNFDNSISVQRTDFFGDTTAVLTYEEYLNLFPDYKNMSESKKREYGSIHNINELKQKSYESLNINASNYVGQYVVNNNQESFFKSRPLAIEDIRVHASTYKVGYRQFNDGTFHGGTDIAAATGTKAFAVANAKVIYAQNNITANGETCLGNGGNATEGNCGKFFAGNQVVLQQKVFDAESGAPTFLYTAYYHLNTNSVVVKKGDIVSAGDYIGNVGNTGMSLGSHLHLQSWISSRDEYLIPSGISRGDIEGWKKCLDSTMFLDNDFRNHIFGR